MDQEQYQKITEQLAQQNYDTLLQLYSKTEELKTRFKTRYIDFMYPLTGPTARHKYYKAMEFYKAGKNHKFRALTGVNGSGKSFTLAYEAVCHWTGEYPEWWDGYVQDNPRHWWIVAKSAGTFKSSLQRLLLGPGLDDESFGTGLIPKERILGYSHFGGIAGTVGEIRIKHKKGHIVTVELKVDTQDQQNIQAANLDGLIFDEEPSYGTYTECIFRLRETPVKPLGISLIGFTAWQGLTPVIQEYLKDGKYPGPKEDGGEHPDDPTKYIVSIGLNDVPHLGEESRKMYLAQCPPNQIEARINGKVATGSGQIYPFSEEQIFIPPFNIPEYFKRAFALDFGWHRTAVIWGAKDPRTNILYLYNEYYEKEQSVQVHALNILARGKWIPGICDPSGGGRSADGTLMKETYRRCGVKMTPGDNAIQAGIAKVYSAFQDGSLKIFNTLENTKKEYRLYHYDLKDPNYPAPNQADHLMDAIKYLLSKFDYIARSREEIDRMNRNQHNTARKNSQRDSLTGY